jgi:hypothetical protein
MDLDDMTMDTDIEMKTEGEEKTYMDELPEEYQNGEKNYERLLETLKDIKTWEVFPKDWIQEQRRHIQIYAQVIPALKMSKQMEDVEYQKIVKKVEDNLRILQEGLQNRQIVLDAYGYFIENLIKALEMYREMRDLCNLMNGL